MKAACTMVFVIFFVNSYAQRQMVLIKNNTVITRFSEGDPIRFQRKDQDYFRSGVITGISQEYFKLGDDDTTYLFQVRRIDMHGLPNSGFKTADIGGKLVVAGVVLLLLDALNTVNGNQVSTGVIVASSFMAGAGTCMLIFNNNYFKIGRKKKVIVMG